MAHLRVALKLLGRRVDSQGRSVGRRRLGQALDGDILSRQSILSKEDHPERAMIQGGDGTEPPIQKLPLDELVSETIHDSLQTCDDVNSETPNMQCVECKTERQRL